MSDPHRPLPQSPDAEKGLLSSFLLAPREIGALCGVHKIEADKHFFIPGHADIFRALMRRWTANQPIDFILLTEDLREHGVLDTCGGAAFITELFTFLPTAANAAYYIGILHEKAMARALIKACSGYAARGYDDQESIVDLLAGIGAEIAAIATNTKARDDAQEWRRAIREKLERMENDEPDADLIETGLGIIDEKSPLRLGGMPVLSGETKAGKSILAISIAARVAARGKPVLYFSLEDPERRIIDRFFANVARLPIYRHHAGRMNEGDFQRAAAASAEMARWNFVLRDDVFELGMLLAVCRMTKARLPDLALIVLDYAQLLRGERRKGDSREQEVAGVSRALRLLSMELKCAVLVLSQLNKEGDTRESTALEKDTTALWRLAMEDGEDSPVRTFQIRRQRDGESGIYRKVAFIGAEARIENLSEEPEPPITRSAPVNRGGRYRNPHAD